MRVATCLSDGFYTWQSSSVTEAPTQCRLHRQQQQRQLMPWQPSRQLWRQGCHHHQPAQQRRRRSSSNPLPLQLAGLQPPLLLEARRPQARLLMQASQRQGRTQPRLQMLLQRQLPQPRLLRRLLLQRQPRLRPRQTQSGLLSRSGTCFSQSFGVVALGQEETSVFNCA